MSNDSDASVWAFLEPNGVFLQKPCLFHLGFSYKLPKHYEGKKSLKGTMPKQLKVVITGWRDYGVIYIFFCVHQYLQRFLQ